MVLSTFKCRGSISLQPTERIPVPVEAPVKVTLFHIVTSYALFVYRPVDNEEEDAIRLSANRLAKARHTSGPRSDFEAWKTQWTSYSTLSGLSRDQGTGINPVSVTRNPRRRQ